jgi:hypothetical protein
MTLIPIVEQYAPAPSTADVSRVGTLAHELARRVDLAVDSQFRPLVARHLDAAPTLHLDDLSGIPMLDHGQDVSYMQDRARLRAGDGDIVATCTMHLHEPAGVAPPGMNGSSFEVYCQQQLGLGKPVWLTPQHRGNRLHLAEACWEDRRVRRALVRAARAGELTSIHPHMGTWVTSPSGNSPHYSTWRRVVRSR